MITLATEIGALETNCCFPFLSLDSEPMIWTMENHSLSQEHQSREEDDQLHIFGYSEH